MNKIILALSALALVTACNDSDIVESSSDNLVVDNPTISTDKMLISAEYEAAPSSTVASRTVLNVDGTVSWKVGDAISLFKDTDGSAVEFMSKLEQDALESEFEGETVENASLYYALYPHLANNAADYTAQSVSFDLAATQTFSNEGFSFVNGAYPAVAVTTDPQNMVFKNLCGGFRFYLKGTGVVESIVVTSSNQQLWGRVSANVADFETGALPLTIAGGGKSVTLVCGAGIALTDTDQAFTIVLPPTNGGTLDFTINLQGREPVKFEGVALNINRSEFKANYQEITAPPVGEGDTFTIAQVISGSYTPTTTNWTISLDGADLSEGSVAANMVALINSASTPVSIKMTGSATVPSTGTAFGLFAGTTKLASLDLSQAVFVPDASSNNYVNIVSNSMIKGSSIVNLVLNKDIQFIGAEAVKDCAELTTVSYGDGVREAVMPTDGKFTVENYAFAGCPKLTEIDFKWVNKIGARTLSQSGAALQTIDLSCKGNIEITDGTSLADLPEFGGIEITINHDKTTGATPAVTDGGTKWINKAWGAIKYTDVPTPPTGATIFSIGELQANGTLSSTSAVPAGNNWEVNIEGVALTDTHSTAIKAALASASEAVTVSLKGAATVSGAYTMFNGAVNLKSLNLSEAVLSSEGKTNMLPNDFVRNCKTITALVLNKDIEYVGTDAAAGCDVLESVTLGDGEKIAKPAEGTYTCDHRAFQGCPALVKVDLSWANKVSQYALGSSMTGSSESKTLDMSYPGTITFFDHTNLTEFNATTAGSVALTLHEVNVPADGGTFWANKTWKSITPAE